LLKNILLAGASLTLLASAASAADMPSYPAEAAVVETNPWDAFVSVGAGYTFFDVGDDFGADLEEVDDFNAEARATAAYQFGTFGVQGDMVFNYQSFDLPEIGGFTLLDSTKSTDLAGHAYWRNDSFLLGAFGQYGYTSIDAFESIGLDVDRFYGGAEAQAYWGDFTLYAQAGYQSYDFGFGLDDVDGFFVNAEVRYFATENWKAFLNGGYSTVGLDTDVLGDLDLDFDTFTVGGGTEYRFNNSPISVFANAEYSSSETDGLADIGVLGGEELEFSSVKVMAGLKLNLGSQTLLERDRAGASLNPVSDNFPRNLAGGVGGLLGGLFGGGPVDGGPVDGGLPPT
jgi:hypothetical protein